MPSLFTLNDQLSVLLYSTKPSSMYKKHIVKNGVTVFTGDAGQVWEWLQSTKQI